MAGKREANQICRNLHKTSLGIKLPRSSACRRLHKLRLILLLLHAKTLKNAHAAAISLIRSLDSLWTTWPKVLIAFGLGKELGAIPAQVCKAKAA
jgi:hypothetical protein